MAVDVQTFKNSSTFSRLARSNAKVNFSVGIFILSFTLWILKQPFSNWVWTHSPLYPLKCVPTLSWEPNKSASSCLICSGICFWTPSRSVRPPADLARDGPITTLYGLGLIRCWYKGTPFGSAIEAFNIQDGCRRCVSIPLICFRSDQLLKLF